MVPSDSTLAQETGTLTMELFLQLQRPADVELSPDGRRVAFTVSPAAKERDQGLGPRLWLGDVGGEVAAVGEDGTTEALPCFSPDGARLAFTSDTGHAGRMTVHLHGRGELGSISGSVEDLRWSPDGRSLL